MFDLFEQTRLLKLCARTAPPSRSHWLGARCALLFEKPSLRTRVSFEVAARELGASTLYLSWQRGRPGQARGGERCRARAECLRPRHRHPHVQPQHRGGNGGMGLGSVINGLTDEHHPCQGLTDVFTIDEQFGGRRARASPTSATARTARTRWRRPPLKRACGCASPLRLATSSTPPRSPALSATQRSTVARSPSRMTRRRPWRAPM